MNEQLKERRLPGQGSMGAKVQKHEVRYEYSMGEEPRTFLRVHMVTGEGWSRTAARHSVVCHTKEQGFIPI